MVWAFVAAGCAQSPCDEAKAMYAHANEKLKGCPDRAPYGFDSGLCSANVKGCTSDDVAILHDVRSCMDALPDCTPGTEQAWTDAAEQCVAQSPVTTECQVALGPTAAN